MGALRWPAASRHWPTIFAGFASGPPYMTASVHWAIPEPPSFPVKTTLTAWLYHPAASGCRSGAAVTSGGVASYLIVKELQPQLPAPSVHVPPMETAPPSGPPYVPEEHDAIPEGPPSPLNENATGWVYQPFPSGSRASEPVTPGGLESFRTVTLLP